MKIYFWNWIQNEMIYWKRQQRNWADTPVFNLPVVTLTMEHDWFLVQARYFPYSIASISALGPIQPPIQWVPVTISLKFKRPGHQTDNSPLSSAVVKNSGDIPALPICVHGVVFKKLSIGTTLPSPFNEYD